MEEYLDDDGIKHEFSAPYSPQQNGVAERKNRTLIELARTMLDEYKTSDRFWAEAINTACHASNRLYLHTLLKKTPYELLTSNRPNFSYYRVFGSKCFILNKKQRSSKFSPKVDEGFMLGYGSNACAYRVFNKTSGVVEIARDVHFDESNGSQVEQVDQDVLDDEEAPRHAIMRMTIGEVRPRQASTSDHSPSSSTQVVPPTSTQDQAPTPKLLDMMKLKIPSNPQDKCHTQGYAPLWNETTSSSISLAIFKGE